MMANYYEKLTKIFLMSGNALYHAAAWGRYYTIFTGLGGKSDEEIRRLAGQVLVSALAVPVGIKSVDSNEDGKGKNQRLTALLGLTKTPTRNGLLKDAVSNLIVLSEDSHINQSVCLALSQCPEALARADQRTVQHS